MQLGGLLPRSRTHLPRHSAHQQFFSNQIKSRNASKRTRPSSPQTPRRTSIPAFTMSLRLIPRTVRSLRGPSALVLAEQTYIRQERRYASSQARENPTSSAEQIPSSSEPVSAKQVPLTIESHGPIAQNPNHTKKVLHACDRG